MYLLLQALMFFKGIQTLNGGLWKEGGVDLKIQFYQDEKQNGHGMRKVCMMTFDPQKESVVLTYLPTQDTKDKIQHEEGA